MKKNYLLIVDLLLNSNTTILTKGDTSFAAKRSEISVKEKENKWMKNFIFSKELFQKGLSVFNRITKQLKSLKIILTMFMKLVISSIEEMVVKLNDVSFDLTHKKLRKNSTAIFVFLLLLFFNLGNSQIKVPFSPRLPGGNIKVKGDVVLIGSTILGKTTTAPTFSPSPPVDGVLYTGTVTNLATLTSQANTPFNDRNTANNIDNNTENLEYIDVDSDNTTFSSSSATLAINNSCKKIVFAGLYWAAIYPYERSTNSGQYFTGSRRIEDWNTVKFKVKGGAYQNLTADQVIFDGYNPTNRQNSFYLSPYVCFKDVTSLLTAPAVADADGVYTVANMRAARGRRSGGSAGGWTLVVIYESPTLPSKFISVFDGYANLNPDVGADQFLQTDINISGFNTLPGTLPVNAKIGISSLEGDIKRGGDFFSFKAGTKPTFTEITDVINTTGNFFNSSISANGAFMPGRTPNSNNTMGYDIDNVVIPNPGNNVVPNNETSGTLRLTTTSSSGDGYAAFLTTFAVDNIEPQILLTKIVKNNAGVDVGGGNVTLGQQLNYTIGFENQGNADGDTFTIKDILPINVVFNPATDIVSLPAGVTYVYTAATRTILFTIPNSLVAKALVAGGPFIHYDIIFKVKVVEQCNELSDACDNLIRNSAYATYRGRIETAPNVFIYTPQVTDDPSLSSYTSCNLGTPQSTNFLVGVDDCIFTKSEVLCGNSVVLTASNGYNSYKWSTAPFTNTGTTTGTILGNSQTLTVTNPGTYYVYNTAIAPCLSITEVVTVTRFGGVINNPVIPFADQVLTCPNDGKLLPNIFLCGANASRLINTNISDGSTIVWERLTESTTCNTVTNSSCANEGSADSCWTSAGPNGATFTANASGQFRVTLNYPGGCFNRFYFNVYKNVLNPTETHRDIICSTPGNITINGVGSGYEYSINGTTYQASNSFSVNTAALYTAYIRQVGVATNPCVFTIPNIPIRRRDFSITAVATQPLCFGDKGTIKVAANDVVPQYNYFIYDGGTLVSSVGPIVAADYTFANLNPGKTYQVRVTTPDGCDQSQWIYINQPASALSATAALIEPLTSCSDGRILITAQGGVGPYYYFINGSATFQTSNEIIVTAPGPYAIRVVDSNNCVVNTSITVASNTKPTYTVTAPASINCYNDNATIAVNLTNANGYSISYSIDNGGSFKNGTATGATFPNLTPGTYNVVVRYGITYTPQYGSPTTKYCTDPAQTIVITGPTSAVTASGGVAELAGCTLPTAGVNQGGKLRINNPQGGTPAYEYSFDGGATWQASNEKDVLPGTYILAIRDALGCTYTIPYSIILDPKPVEPTIAVAPPVFNCNGTATSTVTVTNSASNYTYEYLIDNTPNTPVTNNVFTNVVSGPHTISVKYNVNTVSTYSNLLQEDFGKGGYTTTPGINPAYCFEDETTPHPVGFPCGGFNDYQINDGKYAVASTIKTNFGGTWLVAKDHTLPSDPLGRFLCVNVGGSAGIGGILYSKPIKDVIPNQPVIISLWAENLIKSIHPGYDDPKLTIQLVNNLGLPSEFVVATTPVATPWVVPKSDKWEYNELSLNPGAYNNLSFVIRSYNNEFNGNDVLIDDIWVRQIPKSCITQKDFPIIIDSNRAFTASVTGSKNVSCAGGNDGEITIAVQNFAPAGFYYYLDGATVPQVGTTSPFTISNLSAGPHTVRVQYDLSASPCLFTLPQTITAPAAVTVTASVTTPATCTTGATITAVGAGGTPAYQYELRNTATPVAVVRAFQASAQFTNVPTGNYVVFARDANLCVSTVGAPVNVVAPASLTATLNASSDLCYDTVNQASLVVNVSGGRAPFTYSLDSGLGQSSNTFTGVGVGTHSILVTDSNNCTATILNIVIAPQLQFTATLAQDLTCSVDASITSTISGGSVGSYTYTGTRNGTALSPAPSFPFTASLAGTYVFTVTDSRGCQATSNTIIVTPKTTPTLTFTKTDITCNNANNGTITVTASNGFTSAYSYSIKLNSASLFSAPQASNQFTGLAAGTYNIKVMDSKDCESAVTNVTIANPAVVTGTISATTIQCSTSGTVPAVVTVTGAGGTAPYQYSFNGASNFTSDNTFPTIVAGTVTAYIRDANGCQIGPLSVTIGALQPITDITITDAGYDCSTIPVGGRVTIAAVKSGVVNPMSYQIISGPAGFNATANSTGIFQGLAAGNYVFQATDTQTNCSFTKPYTISGIPAIVAGGSVVSAIKCFAGTGNIQFTVSGVGINGYDYVITNTGGVPVGSNTNQTAAIITLNNQPASNYTITVTDRITNCTATYTLILTQPSAALAIATAIATNVNCNNDNSQITITATGGTPNYTYAFAQSPSTVPTSAYGSNPITVDTNSSANLVWDVYVKDANDCTVKRTVTIVSDPTPSVTAVVSNQCTSTSGTFTITATGTGGAGTLTYGINGATGPFQSGNTFDVPASATPYTVWVKDANGCTASAAPITVYPQLVASAAVSKTLDCSASPDAVITTTIIGGRAPYRYTVQKGLGAPSTQSSPSPALTFTYPVSNANADTYTFVITDANNCPSTTTVTVNPITNPTVSETHVNPSCSGNANGSVQLVGAGGSGGYEYSFNGSLFTSTSLYSGLSAGIAYSYQVRDSKGCVSTPATITLTQPTTLVVTATATTFSCSATNTKQSAIVTIAVPTTGTAPYTYSFNGGGFTSTRTLTVNDNNTDQTINYSVRDNNGCIQAGTAIIINRLNPPTIASITGTPIYCAPVANTTSTVTVTRTAGTGVGTLAYTIESGPITNTTGATTGVFTSLTPGTYEFKVTDASGCFAIQSYTVPVATPITAIATKLTDVDCFGNSTGSIRYNVSGFGTTYSYSINGNPAFTNQTAAVFTLPNLGAATYTVVFTDETTNCTASTSVIITQPSAVLNLALVSNINASCTKATSTVTVNATGGTSSYQYAILDADDIISTPVYGSSAVFSINSNSGADLNWVIYVRDANGCTDTLPVTIATDLMPSVTASVQNQCTATANSFAIKAVGTSGVAPYTYTINTGVAPTGALLDTFTVTAGTYTITVRDANNCTSTTTVTVNAVLTASATLTKDLTCSPAPTQATIAINVTGGLAGYTYRVSVNGSPFGAPTLPDTIVGNVFTTNNAGSYRFEVTDSTLPTIAACTTITNTLTINPITPPVITSLTQTPILCYGDKASITVNQDLTKGVAPFTYSVVETSAPSIILGTSNLPAGTYSVTVTDAKGCTDSEIITIIEPKPIVIVHHEIPITCDTSDPTTPKSKGSIFIDEINDGLGGVPGSGGTAPYDYYVTGVNGYSEVEMDNPGTVSTKFDVVDFGLYQINVVDANGCSVLIQDVLVASPPTDLDITVSSPPADCSIQGSALVSIGASSSVTGSGPFYFRIYDGTLPSINQADITNGTWLAESSVGSKEANFTNLIPGNIYTFVVYDSNGAVILDGGTGSGCYYFETALNPIPTASTLTTTIPVVKNVTCKEVPALADGSVSFDILSTYATTTNVTYEIFNAQSLVSTGITGSGVVPANNTVPGQPGRLVVTDFGALPFGNYFVLINEVHPAPNNNCSVPTVPFNITESSVPLTVTASVIQNETCNELGIINAQGHDGTGPYEYRVGASGAWQSDNAIINLPASAVGTPYIVYVKDAYGCEKSVSIDLPKDPEPVVALNVVNKCAIEGAFEVEVSEITAGVGPYYISVNSPNAYQNLPASYPVTPFVVTGLSSGLNTIYVKDSNGCFDMKTITIDEPLEITPAITDLPTCADNDGTITLTGAGGTGSYVYSISPMPATAVITGNVISGLEADTYTVTMTDATNVLCTATASVTLIAPTPVTFTTVVSDATCNGVSDGVITVNLGPGNDNPNYTYEITAGPVTRAAQSSNVFTGLADGTYTVRVNSGRGCSTDDTNVVVGEPVILTATSTLTTALTCGLGNVAQPATVTVNGVNGTAPYEYSFDLGVNYSSTNTYQSYVGTTFDVYVKDANGCIYILANGVDIPALVPPTNLDFATTSAVTCLSAGTVEITGHTGGVGTLQYEILSPIVRPQQTTTTFAGLADGTYSFQVTDANGCTYQESYTVAPVTNITVSGLLVSDVTCNEIPAVTNGAVTFTVGNFAGTYSYTINTVPTGVAQTATAINLTGLGIGNQVIVVTDDTTQCTATATINVSQPAAVLNLTEVSNVNANCNIGAQVTVAATGGTPNYTYAFVADGVTPLPADYTADASRVLPFTAPAPNNWDVWVKDNNGCTYKLDIETNLDASPIMVMPASVCFSGTPLTIDLAIGQTVSKLPATYTINGTNQVSSNYTINNSGTYELSIVDGNGCISNVVTYIVEPQLSLSASLTKELDCTASPSAVITLTTIGGDTTPAANYTYHVDSGTGFGIASNPYTATMAGTYVFRVTDANNPTTCQVTTSFVLDPIVPTVFTTTPTNVSCNLGTDGTITVNVTSGVGPYQYQLDGGTFQSSNVFTGLAAGTTYVVTVRDSKLCLYPSAPITITEPVVLTANVVVTPFGCDIANAPKDAVVTITAFDGTPGYSYSFDGGNTFQQDPSFAVNSAQTISYEVRDVNGCTVIGTIDVDPYTPPTDMDLTASPIYCNTPGTVATVTVNTVTGGVAPYTYEIILPVAAVTAPSAPSPAPFSFANLAPDTYTIKVTDTNGCSTTKSIIVEEAPKIEVTAQLISDVLCNGGNTGAIDFTVFNYIDPTIKYSFNLVPAVGVFIQTGDVISYTGLSAGNYTFTVTDGVSGCVDSVVDFTVGEPALALNSTSVATNINCNNDTATIDITVVGGTLPYGYAVARATDPVPAPSSFVASSQLVVDTNSGADMNWIVYVRDVNGCSITNTQTIILDANPTITTAIATQCPSATGTYDITVTATGFSPALEYSIDGANFQASNIITVNAPGNYNVTVKDANGCLSAPTAVTILQPLTLAGSLTKVPTCNDADAEVTLTATGGTIPASYEYSIDGLTYVANNVFAGLAPSVTPYTFYVRDTGTNCVESIDFTIEPAAVIDGFALIPTHVTCNLGNDGTITASITTPSVGVNDNPVYMYSLNGGTPQASNVFTGLIAGTYTVSVISGRGCEATASTTVNEPAVILVPTPTPVQFACNSGSNVMNFATITVTGVTGGSGIYNQYEFIKEGTPNVQVQFSSSNVYTESDQAGGSYIVNVYDSNGCVGSAPSTIVINPFITLDKINLTVTTAITCSNLEEIAVAAVDASNTVIAGIQYSLTDVSGAITFTPNTTGNFTGLAVGQYIITALNTVTDCSIQKIHYVNEPNTFELETSNITDVVCFGANDGTATITFIDNTPSPTNEAGVFNFTVTGPVPSSGTSTGTVHNLIGLEKGTYTVSATLVGSPFCTVSTIFTIDGPNSPLVGTETHTEITCIPGSDGTISASATGGSQVGYQYELVGPVNVAYSSNPEFTGLTAGTYTVNVRDSKGCVYPMSVTLNNPTPIVITATATVPVLTCKGDNSGEITVNTTTGGQGSNYLYTINTTSATPIITSGPQTSPIFSGLPAGTYTISVTDGWECSGATSIPIVITEPTYVEASLVLASSQTCLTQSTVTLSATGGTGMYSYSDTANFATVIGSFASSVTFPVPVGTHRYYVRDANGCVGFVSNDIKIDPLPTLTVNLDYFTASVNCNGDITGVIVAKATGGLGNYVYTLYNNATNLPIAGAIQNTPGNFTQLAANIPYRVEVQSGDCNASSIVRTIAEPAAPLVALAVPTPVTCNGLKNGRIVVTASGGTGIIKYAISPNLDQFFDRGVFENLTTGSYDIITQDQNGCYTYETGILITEPTPIVASVNPASVVPEMCAGDKDGGFVVTMSGGTEPYQVRVDGGAYVQGVIGQTDFLFSGLSGGMHTVDYRDARFCSNGFDFPLPDAVNLDPQFGMTTECVNNAPGNVITVTVDASVNPADVDYALDGIAPYQASNVFVNVPPGIHYIVARHTNGCEKETDKFNINQVVPLTLQLKEGGLNEIVTITTGGAGGYQYTLNGEDMGSQNKFIYYKSGTYIVTVTDANGCFAQQSITVKFIDIDIPNVFTPNEDGDNDGWSPENTANYPDLVFFVFDRYGRKVGTYKEGEFWDGKYEGKELPTGDYWYVIKLQNEEDAREFVGHFTLYR